MVLLTWLTSCLTTAAMPAHSLLPSTVGQVHSVMAVYGRATRLVASGSISVSTSQLISALDSLEWVILRAIWTVSLVERTYRWTFATFSGRPLHLCSWIWMDGAATLSIRKPWANPPQVSTALTSNSNQCSCLTPTHVPMRQWLVSHSCVRCSSMIAMITPTAAQHAISICMVHRSSLHLSIRTPQPTRRATTCAMASICQREHGTITSRVLPTKVAVCLMIISHPSGSCLSWWKRVLSFRWSIRITTHQKSTRAVVSLSSIQTARASLPSMMTMVQRRSISLVRRLQRSSPLNLTTSRCWP